MYIYFDATYVVVNSFKRRVMKKIKLDNYLKSFLTESNKISAHDQRESDEINDESDIVRCPTVI